MAELIGGNGFISAFIGGMVFGHTVRSSCTFLYEFMETEGQLLMFITFLIFGILISTLLTLVVIQVVYYALKSDPATNIE